MIVLPPQLIEQIQAYDPTLDILWNNLKRRWIVVQKLNKLFPVTESLRGVATISGEYSNYKTMFVCELEDGTPVEPGPWIVGRIWEVAPMAQESHLIDARERAHEEMKEREFQRELEDLSDSVKSDLHAYGGISRYGGDDPRLAKKHIIIESS